MCNLWLTRVLAGIHVESVRSLRQDVIVQYLPVVADGQRGNKLNAVKAVGLAAPFQLIGCSFVCGRWFRDGVRCRRTVLINVNFVGLSETPCERSR